MFIGPPVGAFVDVTGAGVDATGAGVDATGAVVIGASVGGYKEAIK